MIHEPRQSDHHARHRKRAALVDFDRSEEPYAQTRIAEHFVGERLGEHVDLPRLQLVLIEAVEVTLGDRLGLGLAHRDDKLARLFVLARRDGRRRALRDEQARTGRELHELRDESDDLPPHRDGDAPR